MELKKSKPNIILSIISIVVAVAVFFVTVSDAVAVVVTNYDTGHTTGYSCVNIAYGYTEYYDVISFPPFL